MSQNVLTFIAMADWIDRNREHDRSYVFTNAYSCACAQYAHSLGIPGDAWISQIQLEGKGFWYEANHLAGLGTHTFGALSERLRYAASGAAS